MSFGWLGTFRQGSWQAFRRFILNERRDVAARIRYIEAELIRVGEVTVYYASEEDNEGNVDVTEERIGFAVTEGSSLGKLVQAYIAMGGNPFDISLFLSPDTTVLLDETNPDDAGAPMQPHDGVAFPKSGSYAPGQLYEGGYISIKKYVPARVGGRVFLEDSKVATRVDIGRRWARKEIRNRLNDIEYRIIKLCDLREQLLGELDAITLAVAGVTAVIPQLDEDRYDKDLSVAQIVAAIDSVFYDMDETNTPDFTTENQETLGNYPFLLSDLSPDEDNTAL